MEPHPESTSAALKKLGDAVENFVVTFIEEITATLKRFNDRLENGRIRKD